MDPVELIRRITGGAAVGGIGYGVMGGLGGAASAPAGERSEGFWRGAKKVAPYGAALGAALNPLQLHLLEKAIEGSEGAALGYAGGNIAGGLSGLGALYHGYRAGEKPKTAMYAGFLDELKKITTTK